MEARAVSESYAMLVRWLGIVDANSAGFVHGGTIMKLCDEVAGLAAVRHSRCQVVTAERPDVGEVRHTNTAYLTMVALDAEGRPTPVPRLLVTTEEERRRERAAQTRRKNRLAEREEIVAAGNA